MTYQLAQRGVRPVLKDVHISSLGVRPEIHSRFFTVGTTPEWCEHWTSDMLMCNPPL